MADCILGLDAALGTCSAAVLADGAVLAEAQAPGGRGQGEVLPKLAARVLAAAGVDPGALDAVAVTVGPGSFTGLRTALALAHGLAAGAAAALVGVTVAEALAQPLRIGRRALWVAIDTRRGRIFLDRGEGPEAVALDSLPEAPGPVALAGDAAPQVAAALAARGCDVMLTDMRHPAARHVAAVGGLRLAGGLAPIAVQPLYVDPPEARPAAGGPRPAPA
jgi:tRNA threonylcarbamoyladenosine biosynthesis protein TsaB